MVDGNTRPKLKVRLGRAGESAVRSGHPWVFDGSVRSQSRDGEAGELAVVYDSKNRFLAVGFFDPVSPIRIRVLHQGKPRPIDSEFFEGRLGDAIAVRESLFGGVKTDGYRIVNGESDGMPGLVLDRYHNTAVVKLYTAAWIPWLEPLLARIEQSLDLSAVVIRLSRNCRQSFYDHLGWEDGTVVSGGLGDSGAVMFQENGLGFEADVLRGQKTGFFLDQRDNRERVRALSEGQDVLNVFSFSGAFSVAAAAGGAVSVTDVDISQHALESGGRNFTRNQRLGFGQGCIRQAVQADAFKWLAAAPSKRYGVVIVDPPSLAKRASDRESAVHGYRKLVRSAIRWVAPGGVLVAASCSAHVDADAFKEIVRKSAQQSGVRWRTEGEYGHAPDHPAAFPEAHYLKAHYLRIEAASRGR